MGDFGAGKFVEIVEARFGKTVGSAFVFLVMMAICGAAIASIKTYLITPGWELVVAISGLYQDAAGTQQLLRSLVNLGIGLVVAAVAFAATVIYLRRLHSRMEAEKNRALSLTERAEATNRKSEATLKRIAHVVTRIRETDPSHHAELLQDLSEALAPSTEILKPTPLDQPVDTSDRD